MTRGRKPTDKTIQTPEAPAPSSEAFLAPERAMRLATEEAEINASALAAKINYEGSLTVGSIEDEIRFFQKRSIEAVLELGKRLLILRELTPHGEFIQRIELLGISRSMGSRFMSATLKFSNGASTHTLAAAGTQTKMLELLVLDDSEINDLNDGKSVRGITIDKIEAMTVSELRSALREAEANAEAHEKLLTAKDKTANELAKRLEKTERRIATEEPDDTLGALRSELSTYATMVELYLGGHVLKAVEAIQAHHAAHGGDSLAALDGALRQIERMTATVRVETGLPAAGELIPGLR